MEDAKAYSASTWTSTDSIYNEQTGRAEQDNSSRIRVLLQNRYDTGSHELSHETPLLAFKLRSFVQLLHCEKRSSRVKAMAPISLLPTRFPRCDLQGSCQKLQERKSGIVRAASHNATATSPIGGRDQWCLHHYSYERSRSFRKAPYRNHG